MVCGVGLASPTEEFMVYYGERINWVIEVTFPGKPGHGSLFIEDNAVEKLVCVSVLCLVVLFMCDCSHTVFIRLHHIPMVKTIVFASIIIIIIIILSLFLPKRSLADKRETYTGIDPKLT